MALARAERKMERKHTTEDWLDPSLNNFHSLKLNKLKIKNKNKKLDFSKCLNTKLNHRVSEFLNTNITENTQTKSKPKREKRFRDIHAPVDSKTNKIDQNMSLCT